MYNEVSHGRINVVPLAKKILVEGISPDLVSQVDFGPLPTRDSAEARTVWARFKPEQYAIGAIFADKVVRFAYEQRDIKGMVRTIAEENNPLSPFIVLGREIRDETTWSIHWNCEQIERGREPQLLPAYRRLDALIKLENELIPQFSNTVKGYLDGGVNTATDVMSNSLHVIVQLVGSVEDQQRIIRIAENSFPLIAKFASSHINAAVPALNTFKRFSLNFIPFDTNCFALEERNGRERLVLSEEGKNKIEAVTGVRDIKDYRTDIPVIGCIAMVNLGKGSAVKLMWDWYLEAVRAMKLRPGLKPA